MVWLDIISSADARSRSRLWKTGGYLTKGRYLTSFPLFTASLKSLSGSLLSLGVDVDQVSPFMNHASAGISSIFFLFLYLPVSITLLCLGGDSSNLDGCREWVICRGLFVKLVW